MKKFLKHSFQKQNTAKLLVRIASVFLLAVVCICSANIFGEEAKAASFSFKNRYFQTSASKNMTRFDEMKQGESLYCIMVSMYEWVPQGVNATAKNPFLTYNINNDSAVKAYTFHGGRFGDSDTIKKYIWKMIKEDGNYFSFHPMTNEGQALDVPGNSCADGTALQCYTSNGTDAQKWQLAYHDNNYGCYVSIRSKSNLNYAIDIDSGTNSDKSKVQTWTYSNL
jgi:hypothetical protein